MDCISKEAVVAYLNICPCSEDEENHENHQSIPTESPNTNQKPYCLSYVQLLLAVRPSVRSSAPPAGQRLLEVDSCTHSC